jgi:hypothetical protein
MIAKNVTKQDLLKALESINKDYENNIVFKTLSPKGKHFTFTLTVKSTKGPGTRKGFSPTSTGKEKRVSAACWHVHGNFFDSLLSINPQAVVVSNWSGGKTVITKDGGNWQDVNIGSIMRPLMFSEACFCND